MLEKVLNYFRGESEVKETEIKESDINVYEEKARKEKEQKEHDLKEKFKEYTCLSKGRKTIHVYFKEELPQDEKDKILKDINENIIVTGFKVNVYIEIGYLVKNSLWVHAIKKENEILLFIDKV